jgi:hypothetical protein
VVYNPFGLVFRRPIPGGVIYPVGNQSKVKNCLDEREDFNNRLFRTC